jgi:hypothetical protein
LLNFNFYIGFDEIKVEKTLPNLLSKEEPLDEFIQRLLTFMSAYPVVSPPGKAK